MSCPTCDHTMQKLSADPKHLWWCPRCGTLKEVVGHLGREYVSVEAPKVVDRLRGFVRMIDGTDAGKFLRREAESCGILESVMPPAERS
jgi:glutaredoxin-related protein